MGSNEEVAKPPVFNGEMRKVGGFITVYRLYLRMKIRRISVEEKIQWILSYVQERSVDVQKKNLLKDLELGKVEFGLAGEFLLELKKEFREEDKELVKVAELKRIEQCHKLHSACISTTSGPIFTN